jgi:hypothetical protein
MVLRAAVLRVAALRAAFLRGLPGGRLLGMSDPRAMRWNP